MEHLIRKIFQVFCSATLVVRYNQAKWDKTEIHGGVGIPLFKFANEQIFKVSVEKYGDFPTHVPLRGMHGDEPAARDESTG